MEVVAPSRCASCDAFGASLCDDCRAIIIRGALVVRRDLPGIERVLALGAYEGVLRHSVLALKYGNRRDIADEIARIFAGRIPPLGDLLVPVPLHASRLERRGYNQAEALARALQRHWRASSRSYAPRLVARAVRRVKQTAPQSELDLEMRRANIAGAFAPGGSAAQVYGKRIILVDDVVTTGATLEACARVLRACGATQIVATCAAAKV